MPKQQTKPTPKPRIPIEAEAEIMALLARDMRISANDIADILKKHQVSGEADAFQDSYRRRIGQRLMASLRDADGKRELLAARHNGTEYIVIDGCNDPHKLKAIRNRLHRNMSGLNASAGKVKNRIGFLERFAPKAYYKRKRKENPHGPI